MRTVQSLIEQLAKFPPDARVFAYEGERLVLDSGIEVFQYLVVTEGHRTTYPNGGRYYRPLGCIAATEDDTDDGEAVFDGR